MRLLCSWLVLRCCVVMLLYCVDVLLFRLCVCLRVCFWVAGLFGLGVVVCLWLFRIVVSLCCCVVGVSCCCVVVLCC